jgi:hypothetical protein
MNISSLGFDESGFVAPMIAKYSPFVDHLGKRPQFGRRILESSSLVSTSTREIVSPVFG